MKNFTRPEGRPLMILKQVGGLIAEEFPPLKLATVLKRRRPTWYGAILRHSEMILLVSLFIWTMLPSLTINLTINTPKLTIPNLAAAAISTQTAN